MIGCGGISTATDALEFLMAGAVAVQVGTATFRNPLAPVEVLEGIERYMGERRIARIADVVGEAKSTSKRPVSR